ncbi:RiPP maturation radical SAM C-methyltransferase [Nonomuraea sp. KM88]|uniref:RiPP maturation radical SAM C-methyltransferase n=1 Tax=Nonomuraea sp. KM88 TaxID=3457427 RepID=UPI003FCDE4C7
MRVALAAMPWQPVNRPSLPIGILHELLRTRRPDVEVTEFHGGIRWVEFLIKDSGGDLGPRAVMDIAEYGVLHGLGDWVFAGCLHDDPAWKDAEFRAYAEARGLDVDAVVRMRPHAAAFIDVAVDEVLAGEPHVVGFTSTFMQNAASLALARRLKRLRPELRVVFGGANCDGVMGHALHRNHPFVDYVVRGEGEEVFPLLLDRVLAAEDPADLPGVCWWNGAESIANPPTSRPVPPAAIPLPDFRGWQEVFEASPVREHVSPQLVMEGSRGCWWGEKHQCTFCGLNGSMIGFRSKPADRFLDELSTLVRRHQILDVLPVDNILDMNYFRTVLPAMADLEWDLRVHYEIKSNIRTDQVRALAGAGMATVQPGIESLNGRVLKLMDKGVDGTTNIRLLRDCETHHLTVEWNYLYGFPGESAADYRPVIEQIPALVHLQPPDTTVRIVLERFSPYHERPELGFARRAPAAFYRHVYDLPDSELSDLAYFFDSDPAGIDEETARALEAALESWKDAYPSSYLIAEDHGDLIVIDDARHGRPRTRHRLPGWRAAAYRALGDRRTEAGLHRHLSRHGQAPPEAELGAWLGEAQADGLVFRDGDFWIGLATGSAPHRAPVLTGTRA